jgi:hypothetical protein
MNRVLWIVQALLAIAFLVIGGSKLMLPDEALTAQFPFPALFVRFIGVCEVLAAFGMVLPGLLRIRPVLTPLAAAGLVIILSGATVTTLAIGAGTMALFPLALGLLAAFVAYGRWQLAPLGGSSSPSVGQPTG